MTIIERTEFHALETLPDWPPFGSFAAFLVPESLLTLHASNGIPLFFTTRNGVAIMAGNRQQQLGPIQAGVTYPLPIFMERSGLGRYALTQARHRGLRVIKSGGRAFVRGEDFQEFLSQIPDNGEKQQ